MTLITTIPEGGGGRDEAVLYLRVSTKEQAERGGAEGFSLPAQREAGRRKADQLGADVVAEFRDAGESARSADRPDLKRMLAYLVEHPSVKYVIVHKVDRLARNRADDVEINLAIRKAGAQLVSCTENIDETPSGMLLHGIMSSIAEFYSQNLANEVIKGTRQKVHAGGTANAAPIGYLNTGILIDGREVRTVILDEERAPLIRWAFTAYATDDWSLNRLAHELEVRGLTQRPTRQRTARPLTPKGLGLLLHNPYYMGTVTWQKLQFEGKHPQLVTPETFERVQAVLLAHQQSGERSYRRKHYLAGTLYCGLCESKLAHGLSRGRAGTQYGYWFCIGRHTYKNGCQLPYLPDDVVEDKVVSQWHLERFEDDQAIYIRDNLLADLADFTRSTTEHADRLDQRIEAVQRERRKWADKAMEGTVPDDIAREKQQTLGNQLTTAQTQRAKLQTTQADHEQVILSATTLLPTCGEAYRRGDDALRREYNQAWFERIFVGVKDGEPVITRVERTELFEALRTAQVASEPTATRPSVFQTVLDASQGDQDEPDETDQTATKRGSFRYRVTSRVGGSKVALFGGPYLPSCEPRNRHRRANSPARLTAYA